MPPRLSYVTVPLIILLIFQVLGVVLLPLLLPFFSAVMNSPSITSGSDTNLSPTDIRGILTIISASIWVVELFQIAFAVLYFFTWRAVQQGRNWGRVAAIVLFILALFSVPFGTLLGIFGLIGAFDAEVTAYCNR